MQPKEHIFYGGLFAMACYFLLPVVGSYEAFVIWIATWFIIDLDHAIFYSVKTLNFNPVKFWKWSKHHRERWLRIPGHKKRELQHPIYIFHGIEALVVLFLLGLKWDVFHWVLIGFVFHLILDWIHMCYLDEDIMYKVSWIWVLFRNRGKLKFL